jgi:putative molybdopterin biosynthesis protein
LISPVEPSPPVRAARLPEGSVDAHRFLSVRQVAEYLQINEKKVYALVGEGKIPATKVTGKWLFPRDLVDRWLIESSHGGILTDRLILGGSDDPLLRRVVMRVADAAQARALVSYTCTGTRLGLSLLANQRADVCGVHWGQAAESHVRHPALIRHYPQCRQWVLVRAFRREQGLLLAPGLGATPDALGEIVARPLRWVFRQEGAGSQRFLQETSAHLGLDLLQVNVVERAYSEHDAAACIAMGRADVAPGTRGAATEFGLSFMSTGWEAFDLALYRNIYFRELFQRLLEELRSAWGQSLAESLGGYEFSDLGKLVWAG